MRPLFLTASGQALGRWRSAFSDLMVTANLSSAGMGAVAGRLVWVDLAAYEAVECRRLVEDLVSEEAKVIALSIKPDDTEAYSLLARGVRGYCHVEAVPDQLREVAAVVDAGGYWMPPGLVQRLLTTANEQGAAVSQPPVGDFDSLTEREYAVAVAVGKGLNNREIAESLGITERTVKAHLSAIFEKLGLRDRVQLALTVNRLPIH